MFFEFPIEKNMLQDLFFLKKNCLIVKKQLNTDLLSPLQECTNDTDVPISGGRVYGPSAFLVGHVKVHAFFKEHRRALGVAIQRGYVHQRRAILGTFENRGFEFVRKELNYRGVTVLCGQMHRRAVQVVGYRGRGAHAVKILHQGLVALGTRDMKRCLTFAL